MITESSSLDYDADYEDLIDRTFTKPTTKEKVTLISKCAEKVFD